jgi:hypothetical protein
MILTPTEIADIIRTNPSQARLAKGREYKKKMCWHLFGDDKETHISLIKGFEPTKEMKDTREKYTKSNKDIFSRLIRPMDKVFTARGGSLYYNLSEANEKKAANLSNNIRNGISVRKYVETQWKIQSLADPFGCMLMEMMPAQEARIAKSEGMSFVYPTYQSVDNIFEEKPKGNRFEYLILNVSKSEKVSLGLEKDETYYRVIDDAFDYIVKKKDEEVTIIQTLTMPNYFGEVPALRNSDIASYYDDSVFLSFFDEVIELADQYLLDGSVKIIHKFLHGFPKYAEFASECPECLGHGKAHGEPCKKCGGTGKMPMTKPSDAMLLDRPTKDEHPVYPKDIAAYISPDKTYHEISTADAKMLEDAMFATAWGTQSVVKTQGLSQPNESPKTATEIVDDAKPEAARLNVISEMAEKRHKFILDYTVKLNLSLPAYHGASVNYGRRYLLESADAMWRRYQDARTKKAPITVLDAMLNEFYESNYQSDTVGLSIAKKLIYVEPFVHYNAAELQLLNVGDDTYKCKLFYSEWLAEKSEAELLVSDIAALKADLKTYATGQQLKQLPKPVKI